MFIKLIMEDTFVEIEKKSFLDNAVMKLSTLQFKFIFSFVGFFVIRYLIPKYLLKEKIKIMYGLTLAFCYALFGYLTFHVYNYQEQL
tara:strand:+ start:470 stop:730 length:261 start_codon:yes stop_codon:yes gene_type:complete